MIETLGNFALEALLGKGGMGEVYKAKDQKLGRDVAIKVLPEEFAKDVDRVARFQREAKLLASLNHPNIAAIHGLEKSEGTHFLVLELIEGDTLADRLKRGAIPVEESLKLALQIAEALEAAHEKGVIHRDLKPANIKVTPDGKVKVLDFGLAKALAVYSEDINPANSPTLSLAATQQGVILGTAAYMSPEQTRGKSVDKQADIWAFACVFFEMLTGSAAFSGKDVADILAAVIRSEPDLEKVPAEVRPLLRRCLQKDPTKRLRDIRDVKLELEEVLANLSGVLVSPVTATEPRTKLRVTLPWLAAAVVLTATIAGLVAWNLKPKPQPEPRPVTRFEHFPAEDQKLINSSYSILAVSPNGRQFVYCTNKGLCLQSLNELDTRLILSAAESPRDPVFSPDGQWIGYWSSSNNQLKKVSIKGGATVVLCDVTRMVQTSWDSDNAIVYSETGKGIMRISASGGTPETLIGAEKEAFYHPRLLPGGKSVLFILGTNEGYKIAVQSLESGERKVLCKGDSAWYLPTGHIVYTLENNIYAIPFRPDTFQIGKGQVSMVEGVYRVGTPYPAQYAVSISGTLIYVPTATTAAAQQRTLVWVDGNGNEEPLAAAPPDNYRAFRLSPDGTRVALTVNADSKSDIYIWDLVNENRTRLTFDEGSAYPLWTPDSKRIAFSSTRSMLLGDVYWKAADGTGEEEKLATAPNRGLYPWSWSSDGTTVVLMDQASSGEAGPGLGSHIGALSIEGDRKYRPLLQEKFYETHPQISPNGEWIAYASGDVYYQSKIYVRPFPEMNKGKWEVSTDGGVDPLWSHDGRELFYRNGSSVFAVDVQEEPTFKVGKTRLLFQKAYSSGIGHIWDLSPDGKRFLMMKDADAPEVPRKINVVVNWLEELKERAPVD
jgi:serine/threonine protein kinase